MMEDQNQELTLEQKQQALQECQRAFSEKAIQSVNISIDLKSLHNNIEKLSKRHDTVLDDIRDLQQKINYISADIAAVNKKMADDIAKIKAEKSDSPETASMSKSPNGKGSK